MNNDTTTLRTPLLSLFAAAALSWTGGVQAGQVSVAVAANFAAPMQAIASAFEASTGHKAVLAIGSTGRFHAQVRNGAPFDVMLAADAQTPERLEREGFAVPGTRFTYATGRLVLWSATSGVVDAQGAVLRSPAGRLAIAEPKLAPYGAAAVETLRALGVLPAWQARLVFGESVGQAFQFAASGNVPLAMVALSQVQAAGRPMPGSGWIVPQALHTPIRQDAVLLVPGRDNPAANALLVFLKGDRAMALVRSHGYER